jgi:hypothetical protein
MRLKLCTISTAFKHKFYVCIHYLCGHTYSSRSLSHVSYVLRFRLQIRRRRSAQSVSLYVVLFRCCSWLLLSAFGFWFWCGSWSSQLPVLRRCWLLAEKHEGIAERQMRKSLVHPRKVEGGGTTSFSPQPLLGACSSHAASDIYGI